MAQSDFFRMDIYCIKCQGECWKGANNVATQNAAKARFGIIPNNCIPDQNGTSHCPFNQ